jgi:hypothetical protein
VKAVPQHTYGSAGGEDVQFTTSALDGGEGSVLRPSRALPPGKGPPVPIGQEAGWAPELVWTQEVRGKILLPLPGSNLNLLVIQSSQTLY